jgi:hypothetical protein
MGRFSILAKRIQAHLVGLANWLYGCSHRRTAFPITIQASISVNGQQVPQPETYVVCLDCGRHFAYDWTKMRIARQGGWLDPETAGARQDVEQ